MKIVEIIILMGTQCVSPVQHTPSMTEVSKVQCAVVIEKDSLTNIVAVSPPAAVNHPTVSEAMARLSKQSMPAVAAAPATQPFRIVPAAVAKRGAEAQVFLPKPAEPDRVPEASPEIASPTLPAALSDTNIASLEPKPENPAEAEEVRVKLEVKPKADATPAQPKKASTAPQSRSTKRKVAGKLLDRCSGNSVAKWYTNKDGHKKYRCVSSSSATAKPRVARAKKGIY